MKFESLIQFLGLVMSTASVLDKEKFRRRIFRSSFNKDSALTPQWQEYRYRIPFEGTKSINRAVFNVSRGNSVTWWPGNFSTSDLPHGQRDFMQQWLVQHISVLKPPQSLVQGGRELALSVFALDLPALRHLLVDVGVPASAPWIEDGESRPPLVTLTLLRLQTELHPKSKVINLLRGRASWLDIHLEPAVTSKQNSVHIKDIIECLTAAIHNVTLWLLRAGADINARDHNGFSALDHACVGGFDGMVADLLASGRIDVNSQSRPDKRTALHYALAYGRVSIAVELVRHGADLTLADKWKVTGFDILANPGAVSAEDAFRRFGVKQRPVRTIDRVIHPEQLPHVLNPTLSGGNASAKDLRDYYRSWPGGTGGWGPERLKGYEEDMQCDVDQYWADEITSEKLFSQYIARNAPVLIRGLIHDWEAINAYRLDQLVKTHGATSLRASEIPYPERFGARSKDMSLREHINRIRQHRTAEGNYTWYVFKSHRVPSESNSSFSLVTSALVPTPAVIRDALCLVDRSWAKSLRADTAVSTALTCQLDIESDGESTATGLFHLVQWALGGEGSGSALHYHNTAWNALIYGAKKWVIYPPEHQVISNRQILRYIETDMQEFSRRPGNKGFSPKTCVQTAGDVMIIPELWGHGVLNIQESIAAATEAVNSHWRIFTGHTVYRYIPDENKYGRTI